MISEALIELCTIMAEMEDTAERLDNRSSSKDGESNRFKADSQQLVQWLKRADSYLPFLHFGPAVSSSPYPARAVYALTALPAETVTMSIPASRLITYSTVLSSSVCSYLIKHSLPSSFTHTHMACFLHYHLHYLSSSPWQPYLSTLPSPASLGTFPMFYTAKEKAELEGSSLLQTLSEMMKEMKGEFDLTVSCLEPPSLISSISALFMTSSPASSSSPSSSSVKAAAASPTSSSLNSLTAAFSPSRFLATFTFPLYLYYRCLILSRAFALPVNGPATGTELCFVPGADLLNHYNNEPHTTATSTVKQARWKWDAYSQRLLITSSTNVQQGDEIQHDYGPKDNQRWLLHYGMIPAHNPQNTVTLTMSITDSDALSLRRREMVNAVVSLRTGDTSYSENGSIRINSVFSFSLSLHYQHMTTQGAFAMLRVSVASEGELNMLKKRMMKSTSASNSNTLFYQPLSSSNELKMLSSLSDLALQQLSLYPTTLEEDESWLHQDKQRQTRRSLSQSPALLQRMNQRNCVLFRLAEKHIWRWYVLLAGRIAVRMQDWEQQPQQQQSTQAEGEANKATDEQSIADHDRETEQLLDDYWQTVWQPMLSK